MKTRLLDPKHEFAGWQSYKMVFPPLVGQPGIPGLRSLILGLELVRHALAQSELPPRVFNPTHVNRRRPLFDEAVDLARAGCTVDVTAFPVADGEDAYSASEALLRYLSSGAPPERVTRATRQLFEELDPIGRFAAERLTADPDSFLSTDELCSAYSLFLDSFMNANVD